MYIIITNNSTEHPFNKDFIPISEVPFSESMLGIDIIQKHSVTNNNLEIYCFRYSCILKYKN